jgi:2-oxo-4-hydroxy-4-carboxy-5-ureidoimidazoline decarboxylase
MREPPSDSSARMWLDTLPTEQASAALLRCCGSRRWVSGMLARRPFGSLEALHGAAREIWGALAREDFLEAFSHHPAIGGELAELRTKFAPTADWSSQEQAAVAGAGDQTLLELKAANQAYLERFGFLFIVCASGRSAEELLAALRTRSTNDPASELLVAAAEQAKITALRLDKLKP